MPIDKYEPGAGLGGSKALKVGLGFAQGGPAGGLLALIGANNPTLGKIGALAQPKKADATATAASPAGDSPAAAGDNSASESLQLPELGDSAFGRRIQTIDNQDHNKILDDAIQATYNADLDPETGHHVMASLLGAKHYGMNGLEAPHAPYDPSIYGVDPEAGNV